MTENSNNKKFGNKGVIILLTILIVLVISVGIAVGTYVITNDKKDSYNNTDMSNLVVDESNLEEVKGQIEEAVANGRFMVRMNADWNFKSGSLVSTDAYISNPVGNTNPVYVTVTLDETEEEVVRTTIIPVGSALKNVSLTKELPKGTYEAVCTYHLLNDDNSERSTLNIAVTINIK